MTTSGGVAAYIESIKASPQLGHQIVFHRESPPFKAVHAGPGRPWSPEVARLLGAGGVSRLYSHQARALDLVRSGRHVVVSTPTASGKTLVYNIPVIEEALQDPASRALYLFPLKALAQDQLKVFEALAAGLDREAAPVAAIYDGDTSPWRRKRLRDLPPNVLMTNPEMLHLSLLAHHEKWAGFWGGLRHVVVDEIHTYRGVFGSHMAWVFRRLNRICNRYGSSPTFVACSATVGNPADLASRLTGFEVAAVSESGAPQGRRHVLFVNPEDSAAATTIRLLRTALDQGLRTIVYTQSRKLTELIAIWAAEKAGPLAPRISAYRAGFLPEERREIERRLASGELLAVISTSALELGIDIGSLDICLLVGYPGTVMATWQRGGRVGRSRQDCAVVLVAQQDALDQYFMRNPREFFDRPPEAAVLNPENPVIMRRHLVCAASEMPLRTDEAWMGSRETARAVSGLEASGELLRSARGTEYFAARRSPHREVDLRGAGRQFHIVLSSTGRTVGQVDGLRAYRETHQGAVYLHKGMPYLVDDLDLETRTATVSQADVDYFTRVMGSKNTEVLEVLEGRSVRGTRISFGRLRVTDQITGYERRHVRGQRLLNRIPLDLPPLVFETEGLWIEIPEEVRSAVEGARMHFMGGIHALEHAVIGALPLLVLADRNDFGGISTPFHEQVGTSAVFVYDGVPGGVGLTRQAFREAEILLGNTLGIIRGCPCELGCPSCVHSPRCGSGNRPIDKAAALFVLESLIHGQPVTLAAASGRRRDVHNTSAPAVRPGPPAPSDPAISEISAVRGSGPPVRYGVLDVETQLSAQEVGGWDRADLMRVSCAVLYDSEQDRFLEFMEDGVPALVERLRGFELVVGFNLKRFDYNVLRPYTDFDLRSLPTLDILEEIHRRLGYRLSLDHLARCTLGIQKSANGLQALKWWQEGRVGEILKYCRQDVAITRDLFLHGRREGHLLFENKAGKSVRVPTSW